MLLRNCNAVDCRDTNRRDHCNLYCAWNVERPGGWSDPEFALSCAGARNAGAWYGRILFYFLSWAGSGTDTRRQIRDLGRQRRCGVRSRCGSYSDLSGRPVDISPVSERSPNPYASGPPGDRQLIPSVRHCSFVQSTQGAYSQIALDQRGLINVRDAPRQAKLGTETE